MNRDEALSLIRSKISKGNLIKHMMAVEACMGVLAQYFGEEERLWALAGILHDLDYEETMKNFFNEILTVIKITKEKDSPLVVVGPGFTKENFILYGKTKEPLLFAQCLYYGTGAAGMNGIQEAIKKGVIERITKENRVIFETNLIDKLFEEIKKDGLATYGEQEVNSALTRGAVDRLLISDILVRSQKGEEFLRLARENKSQFTIINTLHDSGKKFEGLGGIGAFLRYKIK